MALVTETQQEAWLDRYPSLRYIAPFIFFFLLIAAVPAIPMPLVWQAPPRIVLLAIICAICWPPELSIRPSRWFASTLLGTGVFFLWIAPDVLIPGYRQSPLFSNWVTGHLRISMPVAALQNHWVLMWRTVRATMIVPVVEELFWRGWLMRWLIHTDFRRVPLGTYAPAAFAITAVLFASEHGPYWDVGLATGIIYNWWMVRSKSVADCILMHAVTNGLLCAYIISTGQWQYWL